MGHTKLTAEQERDLLTRARNGSAPERSAATEALLAALRPGIIDLCVYVTGDLDDANDAAQEALLAIHRALAGFRDESRISTWAYRIALREALAARRPAALRQPLQPDEPFNEPMRDLEARDHWRAVVRAMDVLSAEQRAVISLFAVEGLTHAEIAAVLGVQEGTIWSRLHAARKRLRDALGDPRSP